MRIYIILTDDKRGGTKMSNKESALLSIDNNKELFIDLSDDIWEHPETGFHEHFAMENYCRILEEHGFQIKKNLAGIPTAFSASFGSGKPVIGILGEFDALPGLSQEAGKFVQKEKLPGEAGHGCGHNLLGVGSLSAAFAVQEYLKKGHGGTIIFFGCPAEENGSGKGFMARDGVFDELDAAFSWHPDELTSCQTGSTLANYKICYRFKGMSSHAAICPESGRSALDAAELMNVGVQFLREHVKQEIRMHYAFMDAGGTAPGVVQSHASLMYLLRAPQLYQVKELYERVNKIARGAALMTETEVDIEFVKACSNILVNRTLMEVMQENMEQLGSVPFTEEDMEYAKKVCETPGMTDDYFPERLSAVRNLEEKKKLEEERKLPLRGMVFPLSETEEVSPASSDVGDVSWNCPTAQISVTTMPAGTPMHSWQEVSVGKSGMAHSGMLYAGKVIAGSVIDVLEHPEILEKAKDELKGRMGEHTYVAPIPPGVKPDLAN